MKSQAQRDAQLVAMEAARGAAARRAQAKRDAERVVADLAAETANHRHTWRNWDYVLNYTYQVRECRECGFAEIHPFRPL